MLLIKNVSFKDLLLFCEAWLSLGLARLILLFLPFKRVVSFLGKNGKKSPATSSPKINEQQGVKLAISRASHRSFWRTMCFEQALAAKFMLRRRNINSTIHFGVAKAIDTNKIAAHAWLESNGFIVTGEKGHRNFSIISSFTD